MGRPGIYLRRDPGPPADAPRPRWARALLDALGGTADDVARTLLAAGYRGRPGPAHCPVWHYLARNGLPDCRVQATYVLIPDGWGRGRDCHLALPWPVADFLLAFDCGLYAALCDVAPRLVWPRSHADGT